MNLFLTGDRRCGKSTALKKIVLSLGVSAAGFATVFDDRFSSLPRNLYIQPWGLPPVFSADRLAARVGGGAPEAYIEVFNAMGEKFLSEASNTDIIIMDELGFLERDADLFHKAVIDTLKGEKTVIGVIRKGFPGWSGEAAQLGYVLEVTEENRNDIPRIAVGMIRNE